jgi:CubicO group peptidase (beta-lactamase class C family)
MPANSQSSTSDLDVLDPIVQTAIQNHEVPGAVLLVGHDGRVIYRKAFGSRSLEPTRTPMTVDTVFDIASLTKVVATTTAVMQLVEKGKIRLNDPVVKYIAEFGQNGKTDITVRDLLTHYSGLPPDLDLTHPWTGHDVAYTMAFASTPISPPGARFVYSDINFIVLAAVIERVSGLPLDSYCTQNVFSPLGMLHTRFHPPADWRPQIAPTEYDERGLMLHGVVHDPTVRRMGGVSGQAGLFSTADDLAKFAQALLDRRSIAPCGNRVARPRLGH